MKLINLISCIQSVDEGIILCFYLNGGAGEPFYTCNCDTFANDEFYQILENYLDFQVELIIYENEISVFLTK